MRRRLIKRGREVISPTDGGRHFLGEVLSGHHRQQGGHLSFCGGFTKPLTGCLNPASHLVEAKIRIMIEFEMQWREVPSTCEPCSTCTEVIYGKQYQLFTVINGQATPMETVLCESCYQAVEND